MRLLNPASTSRRRKVWKRRSRNDPVDGSDLDVHLRIHRQDGDRLVRKRVPGVHQVNAQLRPPHQQFLEGERSAERDPEARTALLIRRPGLRETGVEPHGNIELLGQRPVRIEPWVIRPQAHVLRAHLAKPGESSGGMLGGDDVRETGSGQGRLIEVQRRHHTLGICRVILLHEIQGAARHRLDDVVALERGKRLPHHRLVGGGCGIACDRIPGVSATVPQRQRMNVNVDDRLADHGLRCRRSLQAEGQAACDRYGETHQRFFSRVSRSR